MTRADWEQLDRTIAEMTDADKRRLIERVAGSLNGGQADSAGDEECQPCTPLGARLKELRQQYIAEGGRLYSIDEINREVAEGRGETREDPA